MTVGQDILNGKLLLLLPNLYIWVTINTSDQSLFPIDSAFKRRWNRKYMPIEYHPPDKKTQQPIDWKFQIGTNLYSWGEFLGKLTLRFILSQNLRTSRWVISSPKPIVPPELSRKTFSWTKCYSIFGPMYSKTSTYRAKVSKIKRHDSLYIFSSNISVWFLSTFVRADNPIIGSCPVDRNSLPFLKISNLLPTVSNCNIVIAIVVNIESSTWFKEEVVTNR